jgi:RimJ/RimL family protein N-acetyltransferase
MSEIIIKPLTPDLADDYFDFFENRAFTDDSPYRCYCQVYQMDENEYQQNIDSTRDLDPGAVAKSIAAKQIASGALRGYLAYDGDISIGWCNANDRANFPKKHAYDDLVFYAPAEKREMAVVCFEIAPEYRGKGVATALLQRVIDDARNNGYTAVVGFAEKRTERFEWDCRGPMRLYEKLGFVPTEQIGNHVVMRKYLNADPYVHCPTFENERFLLRLVEPSDAEDLLAVYADPAAQEILNECGGWNCLQGIAYGVKTLEEIKRGIDFWLAEYHKRWYIRFAIVDKESRKAVGTIELGVFPKGELFEDKAALRLDICSEHEKENDIYEMLPLMIQAAVKTYGANGIVTRAISVADERVRALKQHGFVLSDFTFTDGHGWGVTYGDFWVKTI